MSTKKLFDILPKDNVIKVVGNENASLLELTLDSREVKDRWGFIAKKGYNLDGHKFIVKAIENGAGVVFCEKLPSVQIKDVTYVQYEKPEVFIGTLAHLFFDRPTENISLIGITGTNGKSSVATLAHRLFTQLDQKSGLLSTIENVIGDEVIPAKLTTPDPVSLNRLLAKMVEEACVYAFMEVSSHALDQGRTAGLEFSYGIFTNISHDHLDYHKTMKAYIKAKQLLFDHLPKSSTAISNIDDRNGNIMVQNSKAIKRYYGLMHPCDYKGKILAAAIDGMLMEINGWQAHFRLIGRFNAYNLLAVFGLAIEEGFSAEEILVTMSQLSSAEGRFDAIRGNKGLIGIVDYAHTPDALQKVLETIHDVKQKNVKIITVVGCGGDRDKTKRPKMAKIAAHYSDLAVFTSDNPRSENPESILDDMEKGLEEKDTDYLRITDRKQAIKAACTMAKSGDIILVAGKGHEKYQEIKGEKFPFDDKKVLEEYIH